MRLKRRKSSGDGGALMVTFCVPRAGQGCGSFRFAVSCSTALVAGSRGYEVGEHTCRDWAALPDWVSGSTSAVTVGWRRAFAARYLTLLGARVSG